MLKAAANVRCGELCKHTCAQQANTQAVHVCTHAWCKHICARVSRAGMGVPHVCACTCRRVYIDAHVHVHLCVHTIACAHTLACMHLHMHALAHSWSCPCERACRCTRMATYGYRGSSPIAGRAVTEPTAALPLRDGVVSHCCTAVTSVPTPQCHQGQLQQHCRTPLGVPPSCPVPCGREQGW